MLADILSLERFYGAGGAGVRFYDDLICRYGSDCVQEALEKGYIQQRMVCIGPDCGRCICWLTEDGRRKALLSGDCL